MFWGPVPATRTFAELLTDCKEDRTLRAVLVATQKLAAAPAVPDSSSLREHASLGLSASPARAG